LNIFHSAGFFFHIKRLNVHTVLVISDVLYINESTNNHSNYSTGKSKSPHTQIQRQAKIASFTFIRNRCEKGINYPDFEPGNEFWNWVLVHDSCCQSLVCTGRLR